MNKLSSCSLFILSLLFFSAFSSAFFVGKKVDHSVAAAAKQMLELSAYKSKYVIDDVLTLIKSLVDAAQKELDEFKSNWEASSAEKNTSLSAINSSLNTQASTCDSLWDNLDTLNQTLTDLTDQIAEYTQDISDNENKISQLLSTRCEANKNYIKGLKNNKKTLSLIAVLREAINQFNETLLQRHAFEEIHGRLLVFLSKYDKNRKKSFAYIQSEPETPDVEERTDEEIGTGHIDNTEDEITVDDFDSESVGISLQSVKSKLLGILDDIESGVDADMETAEDNEIAANEAAATLKLNLDVENRFLNNTIQTLQKQIESYQVDYDNLVSEWQDCESSYDSFKTAYDNAENDLQEATDNYNSGLQKLNDELALFQEIQYMYENQVASASEEVKARTEDYTDDQTFNSGQDFDKRTIYDVMDSSSNATVMLIEKRKEKKN